MSSTGPHPIARRRPAAGRPGRGLSQRVLAVLLLVACALAAAWLDGLSLAEGVLR